MQLKIVKLLFVLFFHINDPKTIHYCSKTNISSNEQWLEIRVIHFFLYIYIFFRRTNHNGKEQPKEAKFTICLAVSNVREKCNVTEYL